MTLENVEKKIELSLRHTVLKQQRNSMYKSHNVNVKALS